MSGATRITNAPGSVYADVTTRKALVVEGVAAGTPLPVGVTFDGALYTALRTPFIFKFFAALLIEAETAIWTPAAGKKFRLMGYALTQGVVTGAVVLKDGVGLATILVVPQNTVAVEMISPAFGNGILSGAADRVLTAKGVATETITGYVFGTEE